MIDVVRLERRSGAYAGIYEMYSQREADRRGIEYVWWATGLAQGDFLKCLDGPMCLTFPTYNKLGKMILPSMVIPVLKVNYNIWKVVPQLGKKCKQLNLASRNWYIYANNKPSGDVWFDPQVTGAWNPYKVKTSLTGFENGLSSKDFAFFTLYMRFLAMGKTSEDAIIEAHNQAYDSKGRFLKRYEHRLSQCIEYMRTGAVDTSTLRDAMKTAGIDSKFIAERLRDEAQDKDAKPSDRMAALDKILILSGVNNDQAKNTNQTINLYQGQAQSSLPSRDPKLIEGKEII